MNSRRRMYVTQGGGLAMYANGAYVWAEIPADFPEMTIGDPIPDEWGIVPITKDES